jgi:hypothetical protein
MRLLTLSVLLLASIHAKALICSVKEDKKEPKDGVVKNTKIIEKIVPAVIEKEVIKVIEQPVIVPIKETVERRVYKRNRIAILGGVGPARLTVTSSEAKVDQKAVFGLQYQRVLKEGFSVGIQAQSNSTVLGSVGIEF